MSNLMKIIKKIIRIIIYIHKFGFSLFLERVKLFFSKQNFPSKNKIYQIWIKENEPNEKQLAKQREINFNNKPTISIISIIQNTNKQFLIDIIESVINQTYTNWEFCIIIYNKEPYVKEILEDYANKHNRIKLKFAIENNNISTNLNEMISFSTGDYIALLDSTDMLSSFALFEIVKSINENLTVDFIYSDEDKIRDNKGRLEPHFKPDWSPDTFRSYNYIKHFSIFKKEILINVGGFRTDYDLMLRISEKAKNIIHIPKILYHSRFSIESKLYDTESEKKVLYEHLERSNLDGKVENGLFLSSYKIIYEIKNNPLISIIIPNKNQMETLKKCIKSIIDKSTYKFYEIIIIENNSSDENIFEFYEILKKYNNIRIIEWNKPFNYSSINNHSIQFAKGEILLFLNNDIEIINPDWLERMLEHILREEIGIVGAKLYYPDDTIQHAGAIIGIYNTVAHSHGYYYNKDSYGYMGRLKIIQNLSAVTGACLMIRKEVFEEINGFDEDFAFAYNDIDLCLRIREKGYLILWTPYAELYHYESKSTQSEKITHSGKKRTKREIELFREKWKQILKKGDPYYNPNLTLLEKDFSIRLKQF